MVKKTYVKIAKIGEIINFLIKCLLGIQRIHNRNVEAEILTFLIVNTIPPYDYVKQFLKISKQNMK